MKLIRTCVITAVLLCSFNTMAALNSQPQRFSVMLINNQNSIPHVGTWSLEISAVRGQNVTCNGGICPSTISSGQTISIEASTTADDLDPPMFWMKETSPTYTAPNSWKCNDTYIYNITSPGHDMNAVIRMPVATLNPPNYSYVSTSTACTPH